MGSETSHRIPDSNAVNRHGAEGKQLATAAGMEFGKEALLAVLRSATEPREESIRSLRQKTIEKLSQGRDWTLSNEDVKKHISTLLGRCDLCCKASYCADPRVVRWKHLLAEANECNKGRALYCQATDRHEDVLGDAIVDRTAVSFTKSQYGRRGRMQYEADRVSNMFNVSSRMRSALIGLIVGNRLMCKRDDTSTDIQYPCIVSDALTTLRDNLKVESSKIPEKIRMGFGGLMLKSYTLKEKAASELASLTASIDAHVDARVRSGAVHLCYEFLSVDIIGRIAEHGDWRCCAALLGVSRDFYQDPQLKRMLPHLSVRRVPGRFPHSTDFVAGVGKCDVVFKNMLVHVIVDVCVKGVKREGHVTYTLTHKDELAGFEPVRHRENRQERLLRTDDVAQRKMRNFDEETVPEDGFCVRLSPHRLLFSEIECSVSLVYADNHDEVASKCGSSVIMEPHNMVRRSGHLSTYTARDGVPYPAYCSYWVTHLSSQDCRHLFKFKGFTQRLEALFYSFLRG